MLGEERRPVLPPGWDPYMGLVTLVCGIALGELEHGSPLWKLCRTVVAVGAAYGAASRWSRPRRR
jgi:hypothetical protein